MFVMAGVPRIMQAMLDSITPLLTRGPQMLSVTIVARMGEGDLAKPFREVQEQFPDIVMGSYPFEDLKGYGSNLVLRGRDEHRLAAAEAAVTAMVAAVKAGGQVRVYD